MSVTVPTKEVVEDGVEIKNVRRGKYKRDRNEDYIKKELKIDG